MIDRAEGRGGRVRPVDGSAAGGVERRAMAIGRSVDGEAAIGAVAAAIVAEGGTIADYQIGSGVAGTADAAVRAAIGQDSGREDAGVDRGGTAVGVCRICKKLMPNTFLDDAGACSADDAGETANASGVGIIGADGAVASVEIDGG